MYEKNRNYSAARTMGCAAFMVLCIAGCDGSSGTGSPTANGEPDVAQDALVSSVADDCQGETFIGPWRGFESARSEGRSWSQDFDYSSGLGDDVVSGYAQHSDGSTSRDLRCDQLIQVFEGAPVASGSDSFYAISLKITAETSSFPISWEEAKKTASIPTTLSAKFAVHIFAPCRGEHSSSCWENVIPEQDFPAQIQCKTSKLLRRKDSVGPASTPPNNGDLTDLYSMESPDQCTYAVTGANIRLADGESIPVSLSGTASVTADGPRLRVLRMSPGK